MDANIVLKNTNADFLYVDLIHDIISSDENEIDFLNAALVNVQPAMVILISQITIKFDLIFN